MRTTLSDVAEALQYDPNTGAFTWQAPGRRAGKPAGSLNKTLGYWQIGFGDKHYYSHRLAWRMYYGTEPQYIDHINGDKSDNRICNLRSIPKKENHRNTKRSSNSTSGITGVCRSGNSGTWRAHITVDHKSIHLGCFATLEAATAARKEAEASYCFHENHGRS